VGQPALKVSYYFNKITTFITLLIIEIKELSGKKELKGETNYGK